MLKSSYDVHQHSLYVQVKEERTAPGNVWEK
jgi:hypothetical protein